jgi:tRNA A-37 threonylcarbamoyl transferase component Bud32
MPEDLSGTSLRGGEYVLEELIAQGGQATVYRAYARALDTDVAVKILNPVYAVDVSFRERFHDEARRLAQLHHPNLLEVHWYGEEDELIYIVMRLVYGGTLQRRLQALGTPLPMTEIGRLVLQTANALQHAHDNDVLHLDVKPGNILLGQADWPLVADLGLTRAIARETSSSVDDESRVAGTPAYMSPEQCRGENLDGRADQYSLAATTFELLTGQRPFQAPTSDEVMQLQMHHAPPRPSSVFPGVPSPVEEVVLRGLAKNRDDRYPSIAEYGRALAEAIDHTRGVSLETKHAIAAATPSLVSILALVLAAPFLLAMLPVGTVFGRLPLAWPFQLVLAALIAILLLGIRWHLVGLAGSAAGSGSQTTRWRRTARASAEGCVTLLYLLVIYRLVGGPLLGILDVMVDPDVYRLANTGLVLLLGAASVAIVIHLVRSAGLIPGVLAATVGWVLAVTLSTTQLDLGGVQTLASVTQLVIASGLLALLLSRRTEIADFFGRRVTGALCPLLVEARPGVSPADVDAARQQLARLTAAVLDFMYLLIGYALLHGPLIVVLGPISSPLVAAIFASGAAVAVWIVLIVRLQWVAGLAGIALGVVLGAPILLSLPLLQTGLIQESWPGTVAAWIAGAAVLALLAAVRGSSQSFGQVALGGRLDRGLLGTRSAGTEAQSARRISAFGRVVTAILDVVFLLAVYWVIGVPITTALVRATGQPMLSSLVLGAVLLLAVGSVLMAARRAAATVVESSGAVWRARARALTALAVAAAALLFTLGAAAPAAVAGPTAVSTEAFTPQLSRVVDQVNVDWDYWLPWSPRMDQATYTLSLSCSSGRPIGQFREAYTPPAGVPMPNGTVGRLGPTGVSCDDWQQVYAARRRAAGLSDNPSYSWDWVDIQASVNPDQSVDIVQTQRVLLSAGHQSNISWNLGPVDDSSLDGLAVREGDTQYSVLSDGAAAPAAGPYAQLIQRDGQRILTWSFSDTSAPALRTFVVNYRLTNVLQAADGLQHFSDSILDTNHAEPVWRTTIEVHLPDQVDASAVQLASSGLSAVQSGMLNGRTAAFSAQDVPAGNALSASVSYPDTRATQTPESTATPTPTATPTSPPVVVVVPTRTPTRVPPATETPSPLPTATETSSPTPVTPTETETAVPTDTPVPPRPTATPVRRATNTPVPPPRAPVATATKERFVPPPFSP